MQKKSVEVIVSTYNNPRALNLTLAGLANQSEPDFDICIADDGSGEATLEVIKKWVSIFQPDRLRHEWIPDTGFNKNVVLNRAIKSSVAAYLIFIDGDCVASPDFVRRHLELKSKGQFLSGGLVRLDENATNQMSEELISLNTPFSKGWLKNNDCLYGLGARLKAGAIPVRISSLLEHISPVEKTWNGANSSTWRDSIIAINGFDESLKYGAEDIEMGYRLINNGISARSIRYTATLLHLEHGRPYADRDLMLKNKKYARNVLSSKIKWTNSGII